MRLPSPICVSAPKRWASCASHRPRTTTRFEPHSGRIAPLMVAPVIDSQPELIGRTPLIRLNRVVPDGGATVYGKAEQMNPGGPVKDRICLAMIEDAEQRGLIRKGS